MEYRIHLTNKHFFSKWSQTSNHTCYDVHILNSTMCMYSIYCTAQRKLWLSTEILYTHVHVPMVKAYQHLYILLKQKSCKYTHHQGTRVPRTLASLHILTSSTLFVLSPQTHQNLQSDGHTLFTTMQWTSHIKKATPWMYVHTWTAWHVHV